MSELGTELSIAEAPDGLVLTGEIDAHTAPALDRALAARRDVDPNVRLDMRGVTFMDSSGLRVLIGATSAARAAGADLVIDEPTTVIRRLVEISGLTDHLTVSTG